MRGVPFQQFSIDDWSAVPTASPLSMEEQPLSDLKLILSTDSSTESGNKIDGKQAISTSFFFFFPFISTSWRPITLQYCSGFCHTLT